MSRLTLNGMYEYEPSIFDGMILPADYDKNTLLFEILQRSGQLYPYHQQPLILKEGIRLWFARNYLNFDRTMAALTAEYNPIENYDRYENNRRTPDLTDEERNTGSDILATSGTDTTASSGQDTDTLSGQDTDTLSGQDTDTLSGRDTDTLSGSDNVERTHTNYDEDTTRTYTGYNEKNVKTGTDTTERTVSAFDGSGYQPAEKTVETFGSVQDNKDITGSYKDDKKITGSYKDTTTYGKVDTTAYGKVDTMTYGKSDTTTYGKVDTTAYGKVDTMTYGKSDTTTYGKTDTQTFGKISTDRHTGKEDFESHIHGNIGVVSSQQMIESELELRKFDIYTDIARRFENEFIVQVY